jgi:hypothetical protein
LEQTSVHLSKLFEESVPHLTQLTCVDITDMYLHTQQSSWQSLVIGLSRNCVLRDSVNKSRKASDVGPFSDTPLCEDQVFGMVVHTERGHSSRSLLHLVIREPSRWSSFTSGIQGERRKTFGCCIL